MWARKALCGGRHILWTTDAGQRRERGPANVGSVFLFERTAGQQRRRGLRFQMRHGRIREHPERHPPHHVVAGVAAVVPAEPREVVALVAIEEKQRAGERVIHREQRRDLGVWEGTRRRLRPERLMELPQPLVYLVGPAANKSIRPVPVQIREHTHDAIVPDRPLSWCAGPPRPWQRARWSRVVDEPAPNLGLLLQDLGRCEEARALLSQALGVFERALPSTHPAVQRCRRSLNSHHEPLIEPLQRPGADSG